MGFFQKIKEKRQKRIEEKIEAERELIEKLKNSPLLEELIQVLFAYYGKNENYKMDERFAWLTTPKDYNSTCKRNVIVSKDFLGVAIINVHYDAVNMDTGERFPLDDSAAASYRGVKIPREEFEEAILIEYTDLGFKPLESYQKGETWITLEQVLRYWTEIIKDLMKNNLPELSINDSITERKGGEMAFFYYVNKPSYRSPY